MKRLWKPVVQGLVTGRWGQFRMLPVEPDHPAGLRQAGLYLHVPFCNNLCPYCPYNRQRYEREEFGRYERAVREEIELYTPYLKDTRFISLYVGGGTPTVNLDGLIRILRHLKANFDLACDICIELHPGNMSDRCLDVLREAGVNMISIGIESTSDRILKRIGRNHDGRKVLDSLARAVRARFESINCDLMFALPGQTLEDWENDLRAVIAAGADQISTYPLFAFPYSDLGQARHIAEVTRPNGPVVRTLLRRTDEMAAESGFKRCAVWSWVKPRKKKFSSITRHHYVGFGPSAASMTGNDFYVNTFDVDAYATALPQKRPIALSMPVDRRLEMAYWLYWKVYELKILDSEFQRLFGSGVELKDHFSTLFRPFQQLGMMDRIDGGYRITSRGAYWIHRLQNEYSLNYINRLWGGCRKTPWPAEVRL